MVSQKRPRTEEDLLAVAVGCCRNAGYTITKDDEYYSAVNLAVALAIRKYDPSLEVSLATLVCKIALDECAELTWRNDCLRRGDEAGAKRGLYEAPTEPPIPLPDFDLLLFVSAHGKTKAARLLGMRYYKLMQLLDEVQLRLRS